MNAFSTSIYVFIFINDTVDICALLYNLELNGKYVRSTGKV